ncbi:MAG: diguanylate cyclase [Acidimicrobiales bacterium]
MDGDEQEREPPPGLYRAVVETSPYLYCVLTADTTITYANPASADLVGIPAADLIGRRAADLIDPDDLDIALAAFTQIVDEFDERPGEGIPMMVRLIRADGSRIWVEVGAQPRWDDPDVQGIIIRARPVAGQQSLDQALQALVASSPLDEVLAFLATSLDLELTSARVGIAYDWVDDGFDHAVAAHLPPALAGGRLPALAEVDTPWARAWRTGAQVVCATRDDLPAELAAVAEAEGLAACWVVPVVVPPDDALLACLIVWRELPGAPWVSHEVTLQRARHLVALAFERRHTEARLLHAALHDTLTGIANRSHFFERLAAAMADRHEGAETVAVLYLDLDAFKPVNDTYGHAAGDEVLRVVSDRIATALRPDDLVARLGGDEFAVLCTGVPDADEATAIAQRLIDAVTAPIALPGGDVQVGVSIGIAVDPAGQVAGERLLEAADAALYDAKSSGRGVWRLAGDPTISPDT